MSTPGPLIVAFDQEEYDIASSNEFAAALSPAFDSPNVILDMSAITFLDSTCLAKLAIMRERRSEKGFAPERIVIAAPNVKRVFRLVGFDKARTPFETLDEAVADAGV